MELDSSSCLPDSHKLLTRSLPFLFHDYQANGLPKNFGWPMVVEEIISSLKRHFFGLLFNAFIIVFHVIRLKSVDQVEP